MNKIILSLIALLFFVPTEAQKASTAQVDLDVNNVRTTITNNGSLFWNLISAKFEVPKVTDPNGIRKHTIFSSSLWIAGKNNNTNHVMATLYHQNGLDIIAGPIANSYDSSHYARWDKIWKITAEEIDLFRKNPTSNLTTGIINWPAHGDASKGEAIMQAPFVDTDKDGVYNPTKGDYPKIKGDVCIFTVMNDDVPHTESGGKKMTLEIQQMAYAWSTSDDLNNTIFIEYKIYNRSQNTYDSFTVSNFVDYDLGNYADDYIGTDVKRNMVYAYNGDDNDEGILGYGLNPPAQGCMLLNKPIWNSNFFLNNFTKVGNPTKPQHFINYIMGKNMDGSSQYNTFTNKNTPFSYDGDPCNKTGWWEGYDNNTPGDRRIMAAIAPQTFAPGDFVEVKYAYIYARKTFGGSNGAVCELKKVADSVLKQYLRFTGEYAVGIKERFSPIDFELFPNPLNDKLNILSSANFQNYDYEIISVDGKTIMKGKLVSNEISTNNISNGLYILRIYNGEKSVHQKFIKVAE